MIGRRSPTVELLTGVDDEISMMVVEQLRAAGEIPDDEAPAMIAKIVPPRSIWHSMSMTHPRLAADLEALPGAADAVKQVVYATWEFAFRMQLDVRNVVIRDARYVPAIADTADRLLFTLTSVPATDGAQSVIAQLPRRDPHSMWPFIVARNKQLADVFELTEGMPEAAIETVRAIRQRAVRSGWPVNQIGLRDGAFKPTPGGGELHFDFVRKLPKSKIR